MSAQDDNLHQDPFRAAMIDRIRAFLSAGRAGSAVSRASTKPKETTSQGPVIQAPEPVAQTSAADDWDVTRLRALIKTDLAGSDVILVSNREPYVHSVPTNGKTHDIRCEIPAGGLVSALEPIARGCGGTWIAHGSGSADRHNVDPDDRIQVPPGDPCYTLRRVWLSDEEENGYYLGFANESLWPLCHNAFVRPVFRAQDWIHYKAVNARFADAVVQEARTDAPIVIVQDYHFALLPRMIRERLPNATIVIFWHIPWPNAEVFGICPHGSEILDGMLGADIIGFQVPLFRKNLLDCVERKLESRINYEDYSVRYGGKLSRVRTYPISIAWPDQSKRVTPSSLSARNAIGAKVGAKLILAVGRLDYTKGIPELLTAYEELLFQQPERHGNIHLYFVAAPSREGVASYRNLHNHCLRVSAAINDRFATADYTPLLFIDRHVDREGLRHLYREADICAVPSLHDGMNLVAKEFVAERCDELGVLILSCFAGATQELPEALAVNPFDTARLTEMLKSALEMSPYEQAARMRRMRETVRSNNIYRWAGRLLEDAVHCRRQMQLLKHGEPEPDRLRRENLDAVRPRTPCQREK